MTCYAVASLPFSPWCNCTICARTSTTACDSYTDCSNASIWKMKFSRWVTHTRDIRCLLPFAKQTLPKRNVIFLEHLVQLSPRLRHTDYNYTKMIHVVPKILQMINLHRKLLVAQEYCLNSPKQTQQKSCLQFWFLHTMWLQPPSFSMVTLHFGHSFVFAAIQFDVSESSSHFLIHFFKNLHKTGSCQFSPHSKQNVWPHLQATGRDST